MELTPLPDLNGGQDGLIAHARCDERMGWDIPAIFYALLFIAWITWDYIVHRFFGCKLCNNPLSKGMPQSK